MTILAGGTGNINMGCLGAKHRARASWGPGDPGARVGPGARGPGARPGVREPRARRPEARKPGAAGPEARGPVGPGG